MFVTPKDGMQSFTDAIVNALPANTIQYGVKVTGLQPVEDVLSVTVEGESAVRHYDKIILATSSQITAQLLKKEFPELSNSVGQIPLAGASVLSMGYTRKNVDHPLDAFGIVSPIKENRPLIAISISSQKFAGRAPDGHVLFRIFIGGALQPELLELADEKLIQSTREQLKDLLGVNGEPLFTDIARWTNTMPQYHVGHVELVDSIEEQLKSIPGLELAGNAYRGVGIPLCVRSGKQAAERIINGTKC